MASELFSDLRFETKNIPEGKVEAEVSLRKLADLFNKLADFEEWVQFAHEIRDAEMHDDYWDDLEEVHEGLYDLLIECTPYDPSDKYDKVGNMVYKYDLDEPEESEDSSSESEE